MLVVGAGLLVVGYLAPTLSTRRSVEADSHEEDRFSPHLRIIQAEQPTHIHTGSGSIPLHPKSVPALTQLEVRPSSPRERRQIVQSTTCVLGSGAHSVKEDSMTHTSAKKTRVPALSALLSERAALHGRLASAAQRRVAALGASALLFVVLAGLAVASVLSWWWLVAPLVAVVGLLAHGRYSVATTQRQLDQLNQQIKAARSGSRAKSARTQTRTAGNREASRPRSRRDADSVNAEVASEIVSYAPAHPRVSSQQQRVADTAATVDVVAQSDTTAEESATVAAKPAATKEWTPRPLPKSLYTMRATAPRRDVINLELEQDGHRGRVPVRPVRARRPQTGALSSAEVAAGAALEFDVDSVIEQRRAAAG